MSRTAVKIGPADHGRRMTLDDFDHADVQEGYIYELGRGVIVVSDVPRRRHLVQVDAIRMQFSVYRLAHPERIATIAGGGECKILVPGFESERHPDIAIYFSSPASEEQIWSTWVPDIVVEVVSPGSEVRDYQEKREEYLAFGVREYWIFDADKETMLVLARKATDWAEKTIKPPKAYKTRLLPGLEISCAAVFAAARAIEG
jgi:hypothetical protein